jgi:hypothetical protein
LRPRRRGRSAGYSARALPDSSAAVSCRPSQSPHRS